GKNGASPSALFFFMPGLLAAGLAFSSSAAAQVVSTSGDNGQWMSGCGTDPTTPGCTVAPTTLSDVSQSTWTFTSSGTSGVAIGTNYTNAGAGPSASGTASVTGG